MGVAFFIWAFLLAGPCALVALVLAPFVTARLPCPFPDGTRGELIYRAATFLVVAAVAFVVILAGAILLAMWLKL
jgi:hypothetical protein